VSPCRSSTHLQEEAYVPENPDKIDGDLYVVKLYVEGGDYDGEERACGPFTKDIADKNADELANYGDAVVLPLASSLEEVEASL
jgi:hypothetical protein